MPTEEHPQPPPPGQGGFGASGDDRSWLDRILAWALHRRLVVVVDGISGRLAFESHRQPRGGIAQGIEAHDESVLPGWCSGRDEDSVIVGLKLPPLPFSRQRQPAARFAVPLGNERSLAVEQVQEHLVPLVQR